jgi:hypothetical protein
VSLPWHNLAIAKHNRQGENIGSCCLIGRKSYLLPWLGD